MTVRSTTTPRWRRAWPADIPADMNRLTLVLTLFYTGLGLAMPVLSLFLEQVANFSYTEIGRAMAINALAGLGGALVAGRLSDGSGLGRRPWVMGSLFVLAVGHLGLSQVRLFLPVALALIFIGAAFNSFSTVSNALAGDFLADREDRGLLLSVYRMTGSLGFGLAALFGGWVVARGSLVWPIVLASGCWGVAALLAVTVHNAPPTPDEGSAPATESPEAATFSWPLLLFLLVCLLWAFTLQGSFSMFGNYLVAVGLPAAAASGWHGLSALVEVPMMPLAGWFSDRWGRRSVIASGMLAYALALAAYIAAPLSWGLPVGQIFRAWGVAGFLAGSVAYAAEAVPRAQRGRLFGSYQVAIGIGAVLGGWWGGTATDLFGFVPMFASCIVTAAAGALLARRLPPVRRLRPA